MRRVSRTTLAGTMLPLAGLGVASSARTSGATQNSGHNSYFVDCSRSNSGNGSQLRQFNKVASINALVLTPGDRVSFRRRTTCAGTLVLQGNGAPGDRIVIGAYGSSARPLPAIVGLTTGTTAVSLTNMSHHRR